MSKMKYLGDNVWSAGRWNIIGSDEAKFELWLFAFRDDKEFDPNADVIKIGTFDTFCDVEKFLRSCTDINFGSGECNGCGALPGLEDHDTNGHCPDCAKNVAMLASDDVED